MNGGESGTRRVEEESGRVAMPLIGSDSSGFSVIFTRGVHQQLLTYRIGGEGGLKMASPNFTA